MSHSRTVNSISAEIARLQGEIAKLEEEREVLTDDVILEHCTERSIDFLQIKKDGLNYMVEIREKNRRSVVFLDLPKLARIGAWIASRPEFNPPPGHLEDTSDSSRLPGEQPSVRF